MGRLLLLALAAALALPAMAGAKAQWEPVGPSGATAIAGDGRRVAWMLPDGTAQVLDSRRGEMRTLDRVPGCAPQDVGGGMFLWVCASSDHSFGEVHHERVRILDLATGTTEEFPIETGAGGGWVQIQSVGRHWIEGIATGYHYNRVPHLRNWRTGAWGPGYPATRRMALDLDHPGLRRRMCRPLKRDPNPRYDHSTDTFGAPFLPYEYQRPFGLRITARGRLMLDRCGRRSRRLAKRADQAMLHARRVTWTKAGTARAYRARTRRKYRWTSDDIHPSAGEITYATHTRNRIYVLTEDYPEGPSQVYARPWPRR